MALLGNFLVQPSFAQDTTSNDNHHDKANHATWWAAYGGVEGFGKTTLVGKTEVRSVHSLIAGGYGFRHYLGRNDHSVEAWGFAGNVTSHDRDNITARVQNPALGATALYNWPARKGFPNGFALVEYVRIFNRATLSDANYPVSPEQKSNYMLNKLSNFARARIGVQAFGLHKNRIETSLLPFVTGQIAIGKPYDAAPVALGYSGEAGLQLNFAIASKRTHLPIVELQMQASFEGSFAGKGQNFSARGKAFYPATAFYVNISPAQIFAKKHSLTR